MQNYYLQYAKGITSSLLGKAYDFNQTSSGSIDLSHVIDFQYFNRQLQDLKELFDVCSQQNSNDKQSSISIRNPNAVVAANTSKTGSSGSNSAIIITDLISSLTTLESENNSLTVIIQPYLTTLNELHSALPNLTPEQETLVSDLPKQIGSSLEGTATKVEMNFYWSSLLDTYNKVSGNLLTESAALQTQVNGLNQQIDNLSSAESLYQSIFSGFKEFIQTIQTPGILLQNVEANVMYQSLINSCVQEANLFISFQNYIPLLTSGFSDINSFLTTIVNMSFSSGSYNMTYGQFIMTEWVFTQLAQYFSQHSSVSLGDIVSYLFSLAHQFTTSSGSTFLDILGQQIATIATTISQAGNYSSWGGELFGIPGEFMMSLVLNPEFALQMMTALNNQDSGITEALNLITEQTAGVNSALSNIISGWENQITGLNTQISQLSLAKQPFYPNLLNAKENFILGLSLQTAFAVVMLDGFLPEQDYYLHLLCNELYYSDQASKYYNSLLQQSVSFYNSNIYYSLTSYLNQMNLAAIPNAATNAQNALTQEISRSIDDIARINTMQSSITAIKDQINADSKLSEENKSALLNAFTQQSYNLNAAKENLSNLNALLNSLKIVPTDLNSNAQAFTVQGPTSWSYNLSQLESLVINGDQKLPSPGGLLGIQTQLESDQQTYSNENQDQQLVLQLELAAIQQQWTIVSTALHIINQIYAGVVNKISAG